jgi:hypothetical protein
MSGFSESMFFSFLLLCWGYMVAFRKVLKIYHTWIHSFHHSPLSPAPHIPGIVSTGLSFPFIYMCTQYLHYINPPTVPSHILPLPLVPVSPDRTCSALLFSDFIKRKKLTFFFNDSYTGSFLVTFPCIYWNWFIFSIFLLSA